ncbi:phosphoglycerate mutase, putative [Entamoeba invadens IP1]|uniref:Phosphoglycerate mutase, putative n=1 Tax=Entamoeba invadens IP1 TaxID=370355 RepID=A0A0A1UEC9_ENTIV|nr:phosphoglycerate mutase, putative [Entamoeba invadens IP1]ELP94940.1 phosphoglycerate mutase, putative [Entamoeba invadens IP1]|eukprot:XP_004261711.1 phosphoglycerate mutase, putative [Entamoeba invadens IP1]
MSDISVIQPIKPMTSSESLEDDARVKSASKSEDVSKKVSDKKKQVKQDKEQIFLDKIGKTEFASFVLDAEDSSATVYSNPKVIPINIGQPIDENESLPHGFSIQGGEKNKATWGEATQAIKDAIKDEVESFHRYEVLPYFIKRLNELLVVAKKTPKVCLKKTTLRLVFDAVDNAPQKPTIRLSNFDNCELDDTFDVDHFFCFGITSLVKLLQELHDSFTSQDTVFLCRHGFRIDYNDLTWVPKAKFPHDPPLSPEGLQQGKDLAKRLKYEKIDLIVSSPFYRATQTAKCIAEELGIHYVVEPAFGEFLSINNRKALPVLDPTPMQDEKLDKNFVPLGGKLDLETWETMELRVKNCLNAIMKKYHRVAIISHRSTLQAILSVVVGKKFKYPLDFGSVTSLTRSKEDQEKFEIARLNMFSHLSVFIENPYYNPNYAAKNYTDMVVTATGDVHDS